MTNPTTQKQPTCAELVDAEWADRRDDFRCMFGDLEQSDFRLVDDGTMDTVIAGPLDTEFRYSAELAEDYREYDGELDVARFVDCELMDDSNVYEELRERFYDYGLGFAYVEGDERHSGFFQYCLSWGGPSDEIRFYADAAQRIYQVHYHYMDWFDGAFVDVTGDSVIEMLIEDLRECGSFAAALEAVGA